MTAKHSTSVASRKTSDLPIVAEVRELIASARGTISTAVNTSLTRLHWQIGYRIRRHILKDKRAGYGEEILHTLSAKLSAEFGRGFSERNLAWMVRFAETFPDEQILLTLSGELGWSHFRELLPLDNPHQRDFYADMCRLERWSVRTSRRQIDGMLFERTALSKKPAKLIEKELTALRTDDKVTHDLVFKDPYVLDFLGLRDTYSEKDLETAILRDIERFLLARRRRSVSSSAPGRQTSASSCSSSSRAASALRSTSPSCRPKRSWSGASTKRSSPPATAWRSG